MPDDPAIALVTDSTASLTPDDRERLRIEIVNLYVIMDGDERPENEITDYAEFYEAVLDSPQLTTTSQPSIGDFMEVYEPLLEQNKEIVSLHISSGISGTVEAARQAADHLKSEGKGGEHVTVVDSRTTAGGLALTLLAAANAINAGKSVAETVAQAEAARERVQTWIMVDTLEYLRKGGRIGSAQAMIGGALKIKPIITLEETVKPYDKVRTQARAVQRLKDTATEVAGRGETTWTVQHSAAPELADELAAHCREVFQCEGAFLDEMSAVLGIHAGPGMLGLGTVPTELVGSKF